MSSIRITAVPPGFAPENIRKQWVGVEIPLATANDLRENPLSGSGLGNDNVGGYHVVGTKAVEALKKAGKKDAADFWSQYAGGSYFLFKKEVCKFIK